MSSSAPSRKARQHLSIGYVFHSVHQNHTFNRAQSRPISIFFDDCFGCSWGYDAKLQGAAISIYANMPIHLVFLSFDRKDQGWVNRKGAVRVAACLNANKHEFHQVCTSLFTGTAPHEEGQRRCPLSQWKEWSTSCKSGLEEVESTHYA